MPTIVFSEYRKKYSTTPYPFCDTATRQDTTGSLKLPAELFIDASIYMPGVTSSVYMKQLIVSANQVSITVAGTVHGESATGTLSSDGEVVLRSEVKKQVGVLVVSSQYIDYLHSLNVGTYKFEPAATMLATRCVMPIKSTGVTSISIGDQENSLSGDVWLVGENGIVIRTTELPTGESVIRIDAIGDPLFKAAACEAGQQIIPRPVQSINGQSPDPYGNFLITAGLQTSILRVTTDDDGITVYLAGTI